MNASLVKGGNFRINAYDLIFYQLKQTKKTECSSVSISENWEDYSYASDILINIFALRISYLFYIKYGTLIMSFLIYSSQAWQYTYIL